MTVPAPTNMSGQLSATALIESAAAAVRNVISITSTPPASKAFAVATASFASSNTTTGTTADAASLSEINEKMSLIYDNINVTECTDTKGNVHRIVLAL